MFTGIIENQGVVIKKENRGGQVRFDLSLSADRKPKVETVSWLVAPA